MQLDEVKKMVKTHVMDAKPIEGSNKPASSWLMARPEAIIAIRKALVHTKSNISKLLETQPLFSSSQSHYAASAGVFTGLNGAYWVEILGEDANYITIRNLVEAGREENLPQKTFSVEKELVFTLLRGKDVGKWMAHPAGHIILPVKDEKSISAQDMRLLYPNVYDYFNAFFDYLINRKAQPYKTRLEPYRNKKISVAESISPPFFWIFNMRDSLSSFKVVWKEIAGRISGKGQFIVSIVASDGKKPIVPDHKLMIVPVTNEDEAHYLAGL